mmetsp:Transcript_73853/g.171303  ORF Transcript_73853/g.171303 Transcript_73853/m.171303 type:complete len:303 (+) Transcript_73853:45-953(+)|eukprot:CAMPEP_0171107520 /NCGR_PEP_ID=MMETSP0766_2-20121228/67025_1 /TAXON_ID=439317 /ORGANISM="Gambierdiscus australes, Strain CAWD 149" /LENGTH=302 /DNA_ID=CAMNT_0011568851 /DNA_START=36 /DNA_END=944 /DNA_ORIENTATION=+
MNNSGATQPALSDEDLAMLLQSQEEDGAPAFLGPGARLVPTIESLARHLSDEQLARRLQQEENMLSASARPPVATRTGTASDEELARHLQQEDNMAHAPERSMRPLLTPHSPRTVRCPPSLAAAAGSGAFLGCCGGLQMAYCLGCGHMAVWFCALAGGIAGHLSNHGSRYAAPRSASMHRDDEDIFFPEDSEDDVARGLDHSAIEAHTMGHVYTDGAHEDRESEEDRTCMVCMETFAAGDRLRTLPCLHRYHQHCIDEWLTRHRECPICKRDITAVALPPEVPVRASPSRFARARCLWQRRG